MKRGVFPVSQKEILELVKYFNLDEYKDTPLFSKITSVLQSNLEIMELQVSEEELEKMLDSIILPIVGESEEIKTLRVRLQTLLMSFRDLR